MKNGGKMNKKNSGSFVDEIERTVFKFLVL